MKQVGVNQLKRYSIIAIAIFLIGMYLFGAIGHANRVNLDINRVDQGAYLSYTRSLYDTNYNFTGRRNRMPLYPFLQSLIYDPTLSENESFTRGKHFNIALTLPLLAGFFWIFKRCLPLLITVNLMLITSFLVFMFKAGYFQVELLFYFLTFCCFVLMGRLLKQPSWWVALGTGILLGITHLAKASVLPGIALFAFYFSLQSLYSLYRGWRSDRTPNSIDSENNAQNASESFDLVKQKFFSNLLCLGLFILGFLTPIYSYIRTSYQFFGKHFYNVNSTFYIWYNSWEEAEMGVRLRGDGKGWPEMPSAQIPSLQKYLREHTLGDIFNRFWDGLDELLYVNAGSYGYFKYAVLFLLVALIVSIVFRRKTLEIIRKNFFLVLFALSYFMSYLLLYAWYMPIASGERFPLAQFVPLMFSLAIVMSALEKRSPFLRIAGHKIRWFSTFNFFILGMVVLEFYPIFSYRIFNMFAGT